MKHKTIRVKYFTRWDRHHNEWIHPKNISVSVDLAKLRSHDKNIAISDAIKRKAHLKRDYAWELRK